MKWSFQSSVFSNYSYTCVHTEIYIFQGGIQQKSVCEFQAAVFCQIWSIHRSRGHTRGPFTLPRTRCFGRRYMYPISKHFIKPLNENCSTVTIEFWNQKLKYEIICSYMYWICIIKTCCICVIPLRNSIS